MSTQNNEETIRVCPFRIHTQIHPAMLRGNGDQTTMTFYPCIKEQCMAYENGVCLRLQSSRKE